MLLALSVLVSFAQAADEDEAASRLARFDYDFGGVFVELVCPEGTHFVGETFTTVEESCITKEKHSLDSDESDDARLVPVLTSYQAKNAVLVPTVKDPDLYTVLYGWWVLDGMIVVVLPAVDDAKDDGEDDACSEDLTVTVSSKTSVGAAIALGTELDACSLDIVVSDGEHAAKLAIDRPTQLRAAKGASPVITGPLTLAPGAELVVDGVGLTRGK
jgi:hypothetical protein